MWHIRLGILGLVSDNNYNMLTKISQTVKQYIFTIRHKMWKGTRFLWVDCSGNNTLWLLGGINWKSYLNSSVVLLKAQ